MRAMTASFSPASVTPDRPWTLEELRPAGDTVRAALVTRLGGPEVLSLGTAPLPFIVNSEMRVRVLAASVNPIDIKSRSGRGVAPFISSFPWVGGGDFAGVVLDAPYELAPFQPGDEVFGMLLTPRYPGSNAEVVAVPFLSAARKPERLSMIEAGALPLVALTAWAAVVEAGRVHTGQRVLIHAGAGGVGHIAVQLAKIYGAHVIATASSRNRDFLLDLGADQVIDYSTTRFEAEIDSPVDVVVDLIGDLTDHTATRSLGVLRDGGLILNVPTGSWPTMHADVDAAGGDLQCSTIKLSPDGRILQTVAQLVDQGDLRVHLDGVYPLEQIRAAHERVAEGHVRGKIVLDLRPE